MTPVERFALRARFGLAQAARVGWYASQNAAGVRVGREAGRDLPPPPKPDGSPPFPGQGLFGPGKLPQPQAAAQA